MNKKIIMPIALLTLLSLVVFVSAIMIETQVQIHKGWNLIFGFVEPEALSGTLDSNCIKAIYAFIPTIQEYARVYPNPEDTKIQSIDDDYLRQTSFWVYSDCEINEELNGVMNAEEYTIEEAPVPLNQHQLYRGWNFLAYIPEMQDKSLDDLKGDCNIEKSYLWKFDDRSDDRGWVEMPMNGKFVGNDMLMMGFIIKVSDNCKLGISTEINPPEFPGDNSKWENYLYTGDIGELENFDVDSTNQCFIVDNGDLCNYYKADYKNPLGEMYNAYVEVHSNLSQEEFVNAINSNYVDPQQGDFINNNYYIVTKVHGSGTSTTILWFSDNLVVAVGSLDIYDEHLDKIEDLLNIYLNKYPSDLNF